MGDIGTPCEETQAGGLMDRVTDHEHRLGVDSCEIEGTMCTDCLREWFGVISRWNGRDRQRGCQMRRKASATVKQWYHGSIAPFVTFTAPLFLSLHVAPPICVPLIRVPRDTAVR